MKHKEAISMVVDEGNFAYKRGVLMGHKEVIEFINTHFNDDVTLGEMQSLDCWNEKLKEWEIE